MWVLRLGKKGILFNKAKELNRIFIFWDGYDADLSKFKTNNDFTELVKKYPSNNSAVAIRNRSSQLRYFYQEMKVGDYVILPRENGIYTLVQISGEYEYNASCCSYLHSRKMKIIIECIPSLLFTQEIKYSLGAFRTLFHAKHEDALKKIISKNFKIDF